MEKHSLEQIKKFLVDKKYGGRRLRPLMDQDEVEFVAGIISRILEKRPKELVSGNYVEYDLDEHPYVDPAYFKPIEEFLTKNAFYLEVYNIPCPFCKKPFVTDSEDYNFVDMSKATKCQHCQKEFDLFETHPGVLGIPTSYLDSLDDVTKLVCDLPKRFLSSEELEEIKRDVEKKYPGF